jgi:predicted nucleotidyltransferase
VNALQPDLPVIRAYFERQVEIHQDVILAYLFGSVARGQAYSTSDVDIAVLFKPELEAPEMLERQLQLNIDLSEIIQQEVQVSVLNRASLFFAFQVIREGVLLYERSRQERVDFEVRTMKTYFDFQPRLEFHNQEFIKRIREAGIGGRRRHPGRTLEAARRILERLNRASER